MGTVYLYTRATGGNLQDRGGMEFRLKKIYRPITKGFRYGGDKEEHPKVIYNDKEKQWKEKNQEYA